MRRVRSSLLFCALTLAPSALMAQREMRDLDSLTPAAIVARLGWQSGDISLRGGLATLRVPGTFRFLGPSDARLVLENLWGNPPDDSPLGMLFPAERGPLDSANWAVLVTYDEDGHVEDGDAAEFDYGKLLKEMQESTRDENPAREEAGYPTVELLGWAEPPHYDSAAHKLYWAKELQFGGEEVRTLNYDVRVLGRRGVLVLTAISGMSELAAVDSGMVAVMDLVEFNEGHRYADFLPGTDQVATYGIGALVAGKVAAKVGFFKLLLGALVAAKKLVIAAGIAVVAFVRRLLGRRQSEPAARA
jgi:uncharacterized membrane-anchored protein